MKALTISQPFASLIASGEKWIENRSWETRFRGWLAIHAGKGTQYLTRKELVEYPHGCVVAFARLVDCFWFNDINRRCQRGSGSENAFLTRRTWNDIKSHKHCEGPWCWILSDIRKLTEPIAVNGAQCLWEFECDLTKVTHLEPVA